MTIPQGLIAVTLPLGLLIIRKELALWLRKIVAWTKGDTALDDSLETAADVLDPKDPPEPPKAA